MSISDIDLFYRFGTALVLGLFVGLQREYAYRRRRDEDGELMAGARTFPIIALLGAGAAMGSAQVGSALLLTGVVLAVAGLLAVSHFWQARDRDKGLTTEMSVLVTFFVGALCYWGFLAL